MTAIHRCGFLVAMMLFANHVQATVDFHFSTIDIPGARLTGGGGINDRGDIVGTYVDQQNATHGFLLLAGSAHISTIDVGTKSFTQAQGINDSGVIVGVYHDATGSSGFIYSNGAPHSISIGVANNTDPGNINDLGVVVGEFDRLHGFVYDNGAHSQVDVPWEGVNWTFLRDINNNGTMVGTFGDLNGQHGFMLNNGSYTKIDCPNSTLTDLSGINEVGVMVGYCNVDGHQRGFVFQNQTFTYLDAVGALRTQAATINAAGQIVGNFEDLNGIHMFLATPVPDLHKTISMLTGLIFICFIRNKRRHRQIVIA